MAKIPLCLQAPLCCAGEAAGFSSVQIKCGVLLPGRWSVPIIYLPHTCLQNHGPLLFRRLLLIPLPFVFFLISLSSLSRSSHPYFHLILLSNLFLLLVSYSSSSSPCLPLFRILPFLLPPFIIILFLLFFVFFILFSILILLFLLYFLSTYPVLSRLTFIILFSSSLSLCFFLSFI